MTKDNQELAQTIKKLAAQAGYDDCGITTAEPFTKFAEVLLERMERFPELRSKYEPMLKRSDPGLKNPWARSIVVCIRSYGKYQEPQELIGLIGRNYLFDRRVKASPEANISKVFGATMKDLGLRIRKGGLPDRWAAARSGVAAFGRNNFAISPKFGSWINIETWLLDAELPPDTPTIEAPCREDCDACLQACPTGALGSPREMNSNLCIAHLTYGDCLPISPELNDKMGKWIYGCDRCQEVCPQNKGRWSGKIPAPWLEQISAQLRPEALATMSQETFSSVVQPLFGYIRGNDACQRWQDNARRSLKNS